MADAVMQMIRFRKAIDDLSAQVAELNAKVDVLLERSAIEFDENALGELVEAAGEPTMPLPHRGRPKERVKNA